MGHLFVVAVQCLHELASESLGQRWLGNGCRGGFCNSLAIDNLSFSVCNGLGLHWLLQIAGSLLKDRRRGEERRPSLWSSIDCSRLLRNRRRNWLSGCHVETGIAILLTVGDCLLVL